MGGIFTQLKEAIKKQEEMHRKTEPVKIKIAYEETVPGLKPSRAGLCPFTFKLGTVGFAECVSECTLFNRQDGTCAFATIAQCLMDLVERLKEVNKVGESKKTDDTRDKDRRVGGIYHPDSPCY